MLRDLVEQRLFEASSTRNKKAVKSIMNVLNGIDPKRITDITGNHFPESIRLKDLESELLSKSDSDLKGFIKYLKTLKL